jgi:hypothetical protein
MARALKAWLLLSAWGLTASALCLIMLSLLPCYRQWSILVVWPGLIGWGLDYVSGGKGSFSLLHSAWTVVAGWLVYLALTACCSVTRRRAVFALVYGVLCLLFVVNVLGWYALSHLSY